MKCDFPLIGKQFIINEVVSNDQPHDVVGWHHSYLAIEGRTITWQLSKRCSPVTYASSSDGCLVKAPVLRTHCKRQGYPWPRWQNPVHESLRHMLAHC